MKNLVIYYSRRGQNYVNGSIQNLSKGNAERITEFIQNAVDADVFEVDTVKPYDKDYMVCIEEAKAELRAKARPELKEMLSDISEYDNIFIVGPNWWVSIRWRCILSLRHSTSPARPFTMSLLMRARGSAAFRKPSLHPARAQKLAQVSPFKAAALPARKSR